MRNDPEGSSAYTETTSADVGVLKPFMEEFDFFPFFLEGDGAQQREVMIVRRNGRCGLIQFFIVNQSVMTTLRRSSATVPSNDLAQPSVGASALSQAVGVIRESPLIAES
jgi:hypothetical protein